MPSAAQGITLQGPNAIIGTASGVTWNLNGVITGNSSLQLDLKGTAASAATLILGGQSNYTGDTFIQTVASTGGNSVLRMGVASALPTTTNVHFNAQSATGSAILDLGKSGAAGFSQTVASVLDDNPGVGTRTLTNSGNTAATLTINNATANTWSGNVTGANMYLGHSSAGNLVLTGSANNFGGIDGTGNTVIGDGTNAITSTIGHVRQNTLTVRNTSTMKIAAVADLTNSTQSANGTSRLTTLTLGTSFQCL